MRMDSCRTIPRDSSHRLYQKPPAQEPFRRERVSWYEVGAFAPHDMEDAADL
jgi:hypothetical protein